jgi:hypothetical protein
MSQIWQVTGIFVVAALALCVGYAIGKGDRP